MTRFAAVIAALALLALLPQHPVNVEAAAFGMTWTEVCYGDKADVTFRWQGTNASSQQWLDLSMQDNGWRDGTFVGVGPLTGSTASFTWQGIVTREQHVLRINQLVGGRWDVSQTFYFTACAVGCPRGCEVPPAGCLIKGNISFNTGERIYRAGRQLLQRHRHQSVPGRALVLHRAGSTQQWLATKLELDQPLLAARAALRAPGRLALGEAFLGEDGHRPDEVCRLGSGRRLTVACR